MNVRTCGMCGDPLPEHGICRRCTKSAAETMRRYANKVTTFWTGPTTPAPIPAAPTKRPFQEDLLDRDRELKRRILEGRL